MNNKHTINSSIKVGEATILYENGDFDKEVDKDRKPVSVGWVLPGGEVTLDKALAIRAATILDKTINVGEATITYHLDYKRYGTPANKSGWALPGGEVTTNKTLAITVATNINKMIMSSKAYQSSSQQAL